MNVANFPYSVHDEPTDEWTIEELLHWCLLQSQHKTISKRDEIIHAFQELFDIGKQEIVELQNEVCRIHRDQERGEMMQMKNKEEERGRQQQEGQHEQQERVVREDCETGNKHIDDSRMVQEIQNDENQHPNTENGSTKPTTTTSKAATTKTKTISASVSTSKSKSKSAKATTIQIEIISGPHTGSKYNLKPVYKKPCWVGRSSSKKFRDRGISLNKDDEVSTTHGKFHIDSSGSNRKLFFTDTGSTNGTIYNNEEVEDNVPLELVDGMVLVVGNSDLLIHLI